MKDAISLKRISELHPKVRLLFQSFIEECENEFGITIRIMTPVFRTIKEQDELHKQGRELPGKIVTNAIGGASFHNYGLAVDLCELKDNGEVDWSYDNGKLKPIADKYGLTWGGVWQHLQDRPHFEYNFGKTSAGWRYFLTLYKEGNVDENGYVIFPDEVKHPISLQSEV